MQLELAVDLDRNAVRQLGEPDRRTGMLAEFRPEQLVEKVGRAVDHLGVLGQAEVVVGRQIELGTDGRAGLSQWRA